MVYITIICGHTLLSHCYVYNTGHKNNKVELPHLFCIYKKIAYITKVSYISNCYKKEKNDMYIIKVINVQCYVYKKEYSLIGSPAPSLLSSIFVDKNHIAHICFAPIYWWKNVMYINNIVNVMYIKKNTHSRHRFWTASSILHT